jgi:glutamate synthase domain-containing protein 3
MNKKVLLWLVENGLRLNKKGAIYLADAIVSYHNNKNIRIMKMYEIIGNVNQKSIKSVIRNMHHCIDSDWHRTTFKKYTKGSPTVFEAIQLLELLYPWSGEYD